MNNFAFAGSPNKKVQTPSKGWNSLLHFFRMNSGTGFFPYISCCKHFSPRNWACRNFIFKNAPPPPSSQKNFLKVLVCVSYQHDKSWNIVPTAEKHRIFWSLKTLLKPAERKLVFSFFWFSCIYCSPSKKFGYGKQIHFWSKSQKSCFNTLEK